MLQETTSYELAFMVVPGQKCTHYLENQFVSHAIPSTHQACFCARATSVCNLTFKPSVYVKGHFPTISKKVVIRLLSAAVAMPPKVSTKE